MSDRFYLDPTVSSLDGDRATLGGDEAHHFGRVMRGKIGDEITLFDGSGLSRRGRVESVSKNTVSVQIIEAFPDEIESALRLTVATALPKGDRQRFLVEKLAELGVARLIPLRLQRSVARADEKTTAKFRRYVIEAAKQCGRNVLMEVAEEMSPAEVSTLLGGEFSKLILHPRSLGLVGQTTAREFLTRGVPGNAGVPAKVGVLVGPEGSFTDEEVDAALEAGFRPIEWGKRILRTETACIAVAASLLACAD